MDNPPLHLPKQLPGERLASYFENFFRTIIGISTLGASLTFANIVQTPGPPFHLSPFTPHHIQYLLSSSFLLFSLSLSFTSFFASGLSLWRPLFITAFGPSSSSRSRPRINVLWLCTAVSFLLFTLTWVAFIVLELVVAAYAGPAGWVAVGFTAVFGVGGIGVIVWQSPMQWPWRREGREDAEKGMREEDEMGSAPGDSKYFENGEGRVPVPRQPGYESPAEEVYGDYEKNGSVIGLGAGHQDQQRRTYHTPPPTHHPPPGSIPTEPVYRRSTPTSRHSAELTPPEDPHHYSSREDGRESRSGSGSGSLPNDEVGRFGQGGGYLYDDRVREGFVMGEFVER